MCDFGKTALFRLCSLVLALSSIETAAHADNLLVNGDFSQGAVGFTSEYTLSNDMVPEGTYNVGANPRLFHPTFASYPDHTTGTGLMLIINSALTPDVTIWRQNVTLIPGQVYRFSGWAATCGGGGRGFDPNPPQLKLLVNTVSTGTFFSPAATNGQWGQFAWEWSSADAATTLELSNGLGARSGDDYTVDDLELVAVTHNLTGHILLQGTNNVNHPVTLAFFYSDGSSAFTRTVSPDTDGTFQIADVPANHYNVQIKADNWLAIRVPLDISGGDAALDTATLLAGDATGDNAVDIADLSLLIDHYNQSQPSLDYLAACDWNDDGANDIADLLLLIGNYNRLGE